MLKLYGGARSRASIVWWYLEEIGVPHEFVQLDMQAGEHRKPEFLAINPMGRVPTIVEEEFKLWESGAILLYLAEKHDNFPDSPEKRAEIYQWVLFANSTLATGLFIEASREREMSKLLPPLNSIFEQHAFVLGDRFSVADVAVGSTLAYAVQMLPLDMNDYPAVGDYIKRLSERPAFAKTIAASAS